MVDNRTEYYWWKQKKKNMYESVFSLLNYLDDNQSYRRTLNFKFMKLYGNYDSLTLKSYHFFKAEPSGSIQNRVTLNVVQSMIDTVVSKVTKNKPKPMFLTDGGDFTQQRKAKRLTQFIEGAYQSTDFYAKSALAFTDACIFGTGCLKIFKDHEKLKVERVFIDEIVIDDNEAIYGQPRQMHQRKFIHKDVLKEMFPRHDSAIDMAAKEPPEKVGITMPNNVDMILVTESWKLTSGPDANDGKRVISISTETLLEEEYNKDYFPFVFWRWGIRPLGFFGQGLSEQLMGIQLEINKILRTIQVSMHLVSVPKIFIDMASKINTAYLDNKIGGIVEYTGQPPIEGKLGTIPQELFTHLDRLYERAFQIAGVSQLSAMSAKPSGLNSGKALRIYNDLESERFLSVMHRYEQAHLDAAKIMIDLSKDIAEENPKYQVKYSSKDSFKAIKWADINLDDNQYVMKLYPVSALSSSPAARMDDVQELVTAGFIGQDDALKLLDFPDLQGYYGFKLAPGEDIDRLIEKFIEEGEYETPEPYQNLSMGISKLQEAYLMYRSQKAPEEKLELFRRWIDDARALQDKAAQDMVNQQAEQQAEATAQQQDTLQAEQQMQAIQEVPALPPTGEEPI
jgi:hypothetical protein